MRVAPPIGTGRGPTLTNKPGGRHRWKIAGGVFAACAVWAAAQLLDSRAIDRRSEAFADGIISPRPLSMDMPALELSRVTPKEIWVYADSEPAGATVFANAVHIGRTPSLTNLRCQPGGDVVFRIEHRDHQPWTHTVRCDGEMLRLRPALVRKGTNTTPSLLKSVTPIEGWVTRVPKWNIQGAPPRGAARPSVASPDTMPLEPSLGPSLGPSGRPFGIKTTGDHLREVDEAIKCFANDPEPCRLLETDR